MYQSPVSDLVPVTGLEPVRCCQRGILSPLCLPFHHTGMWDFMWDLYNLSPAARPVKPAMNSSTAAMNSSTAARFYRTAVNPYSTLTSPSSETVTVIPV